MPSEKVLGKGFTGIIVTWLCYTCKAEQTVKVIKIN